MSYLDEVPQNVSVTQGILVHHTLPPERSSLLWLRICALEARTFENEHAVCKKRLICVYIYISGNFKAN